MRAWLHHRLHRLVVSLLLVLLIDALRRRLTATMAIPEALP